MKNHHTPTFTGLGNRILSIPVHFDTPSLRQTQPSLLPLPPQILEERQLSWDQREVELERQLDLYEKQQNEILGTARKVGT